MMRRCLAVLALALAVPAQTFDQPALGGLDPIELLRGNEVPGRPEHEQRRGLFLYRFASEQNHDAFDADPERYEIQWGGACAGMGPLSGLGDPNRYWAWNDRIWIFASYDCRRSFQGDPESFVAAAEPKPEVTAESARTGRALLEQLLTALGGAARLDAVKSLREVYETEVEYDGKQVRSGAAWTLLFPGSVRSEGWWGDSSWADVVTPSGAFRAQSGRPAHAMVAAQRRELERIAAHDLLWILRRRDAADFTCSGERATADRPDLLTVHLGGTTTVLGLDPDHLPRVMHYRGRAGAGRLGDVELLLSDWREVGGLRWHHARRLVFNGKPIEAESRTLTRVEVDGAIDPAWFRM